MTVMSRQNEADIRSRETLPQHQKGTLFMTSTQRMLGNNQSNMPMLDDHLRGLNR